MKSSVPCCGAAEKRTGLPVVLEEGRIRAGEGMAKNYVDVHSSRIQDIPLYRDILDVMQWCL